MPASCVIQNTVANVRSQPEHVIPIHNTCATENNSMIEALKLLFRPTIKPETISSSIVYRPIKLVHYQKTVNTRIFLVKYLEQL